jgi:hypothetical protein
VKRFLNGLGFEAEVTPAIMCVFANRKEVQGVLPMQPLVLGLPDPDRGELGMHVVVVVKDTDGRRWLVDSSCAQARRERWGVTLPGVFIVELRPALPDGPGDDIWRHFGFSPATGPVSWSSDSDIVALYWYLAPGRDNGWTRAPDARRERSRRIAIKLRKVWASRP